MARQNLAAATLVAPIAGTVAQVNVTPGQQVSGSQGSSASASFIIEGPGGQEASTTVSSTNVGQVRVGQVAQLGEGLPLELAHPLGGDAVLGADVGELVLPAVHQPVAGPDDIGRPVVEELDEVTEPVAGLDVEERAVLGPGAREPGHTRR